MTILDSMENPLNTTEDSYIMQRYSIRRVEADRYDRKLMNELKVSSRFPTIKSMSLIKKLAVYYGNVLYKRVLNKC